jgi:hypothetical protein
MPCSTQDGCWARARARARPASTPARGKASHALVLLNTNAPHVPAITSFTALNGSAVGAGAMAGRVRETCYACEGERENRGREGTAPC